MKKLIGVFLAAVLVLSTLGFVLSYAAENTSQQGSADVNGFRFTQTQEGWMTTINGKGSVFYSHPLDVQHLSLDDRFTRLIEGNEVTITYDENTNNTAVLAQVQYYLDTHLRDRLSVHTATMNTTTCNQSTPTQPVIELRITTDQPTNELCMVFFGATPAELVQHVDYHLYNMNGILKNG